jgi:plastocyanin
MMKRTPGITAGLTLALAAGIAACSSSGSMAPSTGGGTAGGGGVGGGSSNTIMASAMMSGGNYFFSPTPDTVAAGTSVTWVFGSVTHNVHFAAVANAPDSIPASTNTSVARSFTTAGTYAYKCLIHNISGVVVVR